MKFICNREFKSLGLEVGDYFPAKNCTADFVAKLLREGAIVLEP